LKQGYLSLVLHAHLPFVRHPEHDKFLEEIWLFEAITETYLPLLQILAGWRRDNLRARLTLSLTPTLCSMLEDPLLQSRYIRHLDEIIDLAEKEIHRTSFQNDYHELANFYFERLTGLRNEYQRLNGCVIAAFSELQNAGLIEIITSAATHALLPLLISHPTSIRAQILVARDHYRACFGRAPRGIWLPECAYTPGLEAFLREAGIEWFFIDSHGILNATPRPRYAIFAPVLTPNGLAVFGRDLESARQVWSRDEGYPGDARYRDFYRDIGFDLDFDYVRAHLPSENSRGFTGIKYHRVSAGKTGRELYNRKDALQAVEEHASHFFGARLEQIRQLSGILDRAPLVVCPYDAELFGHWWYEGPDFLDRFVRKACGEQSVFELTTPHEYLESFPRNQVCVPSASSWGEGGHWRVWLNEKNQWILPHLTVAQERMVSLANSNADPDPLTLRALRQAGRELLLAQSSDWPFIIRTGTSPAYAERRVKEHLLRFNALFDGITSHHIDASFLESIEEKDNLFPGLDYRYWAENTALSR
jgi:1,4-alpha-glucan branching enzyme